MEDTAYIRERVRFPVVGGLFYPEDRSEAELRLAACMKDWETDRSRVIVAPHGAWDISGRIAGAAFAAAGGEGRQVARVVVLGTIHQEEEGLFLSDSDFFQTPLGNIPVARVFCEELASCNTLFEINDIPHLKEHSIEVLLPFVKYCFPEAAIVPVLMGSSRRRLVSALAHSLRIVFEPIMKDTLLVLSCNLSMNMDGETARLQAEECVRLLTEKDAARFAGEVRDGGISACGKGLAASLLESGLVNNMRGRLVSGPLIQAKGEENKTVYYGAFAYE
ncbi:MAG: AmmeMemoRadiSam system protein B [Treponema sp.]|jgi:AmmeMemoRadiSam system protein B|nr:AmmeMemoRadiSam system protein B [Treponema sp.]